MASNYNRLPRPAMVLVADGKAQMLVRGETIDDVLSRDQLMTSADLDSMAMESTDAPSPDCAP
jgi:diaminopimelate decarboxylase